MKPRLAAIMLVCSTAILLADDAPPQPKSPAAVSAIEKANAAEISAEQTYDTAVARARKTELAELKIAMKVAMQKTDLQESNAISEVIKSVEAANAAKAQESETAETAQSRMFGRWHVGHEPWVITPQNVRNEGSSGGVPSIEGNVMLIKWPNGWLDRLTYEGKDKFFIESWGPGVAHTEPGATRLGVGVRDKSE